jgi:hypothetical protein
MIEVVDREDRDRLVSVHTDQIQISVGEHRASLPCIGAGREQATTNGVHHGFVSGFAVEATGVSD